MGPGVHHGRVDEPTDVERSHSALMLGVFVLVLVGGAAVLRVLMALFHFGEAAATASYAALPMLAVLYAVTSSGPE